MRAMRLVVLAALIVGPCNTSTPERDAAASYVDMVSPLVHENGLLADRLLDTAAGAYNGSSNADETRRRFEGDIAPIAEHLYHQAELVSPPPDWAQRHHDLVAIWGERAAAYRDLAVALDHGDVAGWTSARTRADQAKINEESWFTSTNAALAPHGLILDQYP
jgi:hypothetical protein